MLNNHPTELSDTDKDLIRNITECCIMIAKQKNLNTTFKKIDFLEKEHFYDKFDYSNYE